MNGLVFETVSIRIEELIKILVITIMTRIRRGANLEQLESEQEVRGGEHFDNFYICVSFEKNTHFFLQRTKEKYVFSSL